MENTPNMPIIYSVFNETPAQRNYRRIQERIQDERRRFALILAMSHRAVHLSLRAERNPRVRNAVRNQLEHQYGIRTPGWTPGWWLAA